MKATPQSTTLRMPQSLTQQSRGQRDAAEAMLTREVRQPLPIQTHSSCHIQRAHTSYPIHAPNTSYLLHAPHIIYLIQKVRTSYLIHTAHTLDLIQEAYTSYLIQAPHI
jgi:hypothetical protein